MHSTKHAQKRVPIQQKTRNKSKNLPIDHARRLKLELDVVRESVPQKSGMSNLPDELGTGYDRIGTGFLVPDYRHPCIKIGQVVERLPPGRSRSRRR